jgi:hypothetical protein
MSPAYFYGDNSNVSVGLLEHLSEACYPMVCLEKMDFGGG